MAAAAFDCDGEAIGSAPGTIVDVVATGDAAGETAGRFLTMTNFGPPVGGECGGEDKDGATEADGPPVAADEDEEFVEFIAIVNLRFLVAIGVDCVVLTFLLSLVGGTVVFAVALMMESRSAAVAGSMNVAPPDDDNSTPSDRNRAGTSAVP